MANIIKDSSVDPPTYMARLSEVEYAAIGAALEEGQNIVNSAPSEDDTEAMLTDLINQLVTEWNEAL
jgi:hypothetical protein